MVQRIDDFLSSYKTVDFLMINYMTHSIRHIGLVVADLDKAKNFWIDLMGFRIVREMRESGPKIDKMIGLKNIDVSTCKLAPPDNKCLLELLCFHSHQSGAVWRGTPYTTGFTHIALTVDFLDQLVSRMISYGVVFPGAPQLSDDGSVRVIYAKCDDGVLLELVEVQD